jgi:hypothetical protein
MLEGLVGGEGFAIDASAIKADANRERFVPAAEARKLAEGDGASRAVREYLDALDTNNPAGSKSDSDEPTSGDSTPPKNISPHGSLRPLDGGPGRAGVLRVFDEVPD